MPERIYRSNFNEGIFYSWVNYLVKSKHYTFEAAETEVKRMINDGELIEVTQPSNEQEMGRIKRLKVSDAHGKSFIGLDGTVIKATRFDPLHMANNIPWDVDLESDSSKFELITYEGGVMILPKTDYLQQV